MRGYLAQKTAYCELMRTQDEMANEWHADSLAETTGLKKFPFSFASPRFAGLVATHLLNFVYVAAWVSMEDIQTERTRSSHGQVSRTSLHSVVSSHPSDLGSDVENSPESNHIGDDSSGPPINRVGFLHSGGPSREYLVRRRRLFKGRHIQMMAFGNHRLIVSLH